jgi:hypothetical protein
MSKKDLKWIPSVFFMTIPFTCPNNWPKRNFITLPNYFCAFQAWQMYRGRPIPFSCCPLRDMFLAGRRASDPVFMFCTPGLVFGRTEGVTTAFHILLYRTSFPRYGGCRVSFSCCSARTHFRRYRGHQVLFSC